jgi:hypothetical protein
LPFKCDLRRYTVVKCPVDSAVDVAPVTLAFKRMSGSVLGGALHVESS